MILLNDMVQNIEDISVQDVSTNTINHVSVLDLTIRPEKDAKFYRQQETRAKIVTCLGLEPTEINAIVPRHVSDFILNRLMLMDIIRPGGTNFLDSELRMAGAIAQHENEISDLMWNEIIPEDSENLPQRTLDEIEFNQYLHFLRYEIAIGDIGKTGGREENEDHLDLVRRIYHNQLIGAHYRWLKNLYDHPDEIPESLKPEFRAQLQHVGIHAEAVDLTQEQMSTGAALFPENANGPAFLKLPIRLAYMVGQIHFKEIPAQEEGAAPSKVIIPEYDHIVDMNLEQLKYLKFLGFDPDDQEIHDLLTKLHIMLGEEDVLGASGSIKYPKGFKAFDGLEEPYRTFAIIALSHHFSQGVYPDRLVSLMRERPEDVDLLLKNIIFNEVLDKIEGFIDRSGNDADEAVNNATKAITKALQTTEKDRLSRFEGFEYYMTTESLMKYYEKIIALSVKMLTSYNPVDELIKD